MLKLVEPEVEAIEPFPVEDTFVAARAAWTSSGSV